MLKKHELKDLEKIYLEAESCDKEVFSEMRTNLLLVSGEHYSRRHSRFMNRLRSFKDVSEQQRLRLSKNHTQAICKTFSNHLLSGAPGVAFKPQSEKELQDQKAAELHQAVWKWIKETYEFDERNDEWVDDFTHIGEVATKVTWDDKAGEIIAYEQETDGAGNPVFEEDGVTPKAGAPVYEGAFIFEPVYGFNLLRDPAAKDMREARFLIVRKMCNVDDLKAKFPEKREKITTTEDKTMVVFDASKSDYRSSRNEALVKEFYFKPCAQYPRGYFFITTGNTVLAEGDLPGGVFPIVWQYCERVQTTPRGISIIRTGRPYQAEINRAASKIAEHQITLGDDKLLIQDGTEIAAGIALPGVRSINYAGEKPSILNGRDGSQYLQYMNATIDEYYRVMGFDDSEEKAQNEPFALLYRAASQKKKFKRYVARYERYLKKLAYTTMRLAKLYLPDDKIIPAVSRKEAVNIAEFKSTEEIHAQIVIEPQSEDIESKFGRQLFISQTLQYVGGKLDPDTIGRLLRVAPFGNMEESASDLTMNYDKATNMILALDRGDRPIVNQYDKADYMISRLTNRMGQSDFQGLDPSVQQAYAEVVQYYEQSEAQKLRKIQEAQAGFIPVDGYLVTCDLYVPDPSSPAKSRRARVPYGALRWLLDTLEKQGYSLAALEALSTGAQADIAGLLSNANPEASPPPENAPVGGSQLYGDAIASGGLMESFNG